MDSSKLSIGSGSHLPGYLGTNTGSNGTGDSVSNTNSASQSYEVASSDFISIIEQFLHDQGLTRTLRTLQEESGVPFNSLSNVDELEGDFKEGRWDRVLNSVESQYVPKVVMLDQMEHICFEQCEMKEFDTAKSVFQTSPLFEELKVLDGHRHTHLKHILDSRVFSKNTYTTSRVQRRMELFRKVQGCLTVAPQKRLQMLVAQALRWQQHTGVGIAQGSEISLFTENYGSSISSASEDLHVTQPVKQVQLQASTPTCITHIPLGGASARPLVAVGLSDGFIEIYNMSKGKLDKDLLYQQKGEYLVHQDAISCLTASNDGEVLVSASMCGEVKVWSVATGACLRKFQSVHNGSINSMQLNKAATHQVTAGEDGMVYIIGLKSGQKLKQQQHSEPVRSVVFSGDGILSAGADGVLRSFSSDGSLTHQQMANTHAIQSMSLHPVSQHQVVLVYSNNEVLTVQTSDLKIVSTFKVEPTLDKPIPKLYKCTYSRHGSLIYVSGSDFVLYTLRADTGKLVHALKPHNAELQAIMQHPHLNLLATLGKDNVQRMWKP